MDKDYREIWRGLTNFQKEDLLAVSKNKQANKSISVALLQRNMVWLPPDADRFELTDYGKQVLAAGINFAESAIEMVTAERARQDAKWGEQNHDAGKWSLILAEELGEIAKSQLEGDHVNYLTELVQATAVMVAWLECELRRVQ